MRWFVINVQNVMYLWATFNNQTIKKNTGIKRRRSLFSGVVDGWMDGWLSVWDRLTAGSGWGRGKCNWFRLMAYYVVMPQRYRCRNAEPCTGILFFFPYHRKRIDWYFSMFQFFFSKHNSKISHEVILRFNGKINVFKQKIAVIFYSKSYGR